MAASQLSINISDEALQQISEAVGDRSAEQLKALGDDGSLLLKKIALDYIKVVQKNLKQIQQIEQNAKLLKQKRQAIGYSKNKKDPSIVQAYQQYKQQIQYKELSQYQLDDFYQASMLFNNRILQVITGHQARLTVVIPDSGDGPIIMDIPIEEMFKGDTGIAIKSDIASGKVPRLSARLKFDVDKIKANLSNAIRKDSIIGAESLQGLNEAYDVTLEDYRKWKPHVFWKITTEDIWYKLTVGGAEGDISEAYAYFFYTGGGQGQNPNTLFLGKVYNRNMDYFIREGVANVDNISGLYTSDVSTDEYDYAVKSLDASLPGFRQMITLATQILNNKIKTAEELKQMSLKKQYKDPVKMSGRKGLRNIVERAALEQVPSEVKITI